jgi:hypothetical protein
VNVVAKKNAKKSEAQLDIINTMTNVRMTEANDRTKRQSNVVIFGIPVSKKADEKIKDDEDTINKIFDDLRLEKGNIINLHRLKQKQNDTTRIPPIVIPLNNVQQRNE